MDKLEYLSNLDEHLSSLPKKEREAAIKYYGDLFDDAGLMNEQAVITDLGSPQNLAHNILNDKNEISYELKKTKKEMKAVGQKMTSQQKYKAAAIIILTLPLWGTALLLLCGTVAAVLAAAIVFLSFLAVLGLAMICMGIAYINKSYSISLALAGMGIALISLSLLLFNPVMHFAFFLMKLITKNSIKLFNKIIGKTEANAK